MVCWSGTVPSKVGGEYLYAKNVFKHYRSEYSDESQAIGGGSGIKRTHTFSGLTDSRDNPSNFFTVIADIVAYEKNGNAAIESVSIKFQFSGADPAMDWNSPSYAVSTNDNTTNSFFPGTFLYHVTSGLMAASGGNIGSKFDVNLWITSDTNTTPHNYYWQIIGV